MKTLAIRMRRLATTDPLTVTFYKNELGSYPTWNIDAPSAYRATFPKPIGTTPKQVIPILGGVFAFIVAEGNGNNEIVFNTMIDDSTPLEAEIDDYVEIRVLDEVVQITPP